MKQSKIFGDWDVIIRDILDSDQGRQLKTFIKREYSISNVLPSSENIFRAFRETPLNEVKVIVLGESPSSKRIHANGVAFSSNDNVMNREIRALYNTFDKQIEFGRYLDLSLGNLSFSYLTKQGVLLLNSRLTIVEGNINSHRDAGWDLFIAKVLLQLSSRKKGLCFTAWGREARRIVEVVYNKHQRRHFFHSCEHPRTAIREGRQWENKNVFNKINNYLGKENKIIW